MSDETKDYSRGYDAGKRRSATEVTQLKAELRTLGKMAESQKERVYIACLEMALKHCSGWQLDKKEINNAEGYCRLARIFMDNSISEISK